MPRLLICTFLSIVAGLSGATLRDIRTFRGPAEIGDCSVPPPKVTSFSPPSDDYVYVFYSLDNLRQGDSIQRKWINLPTNNVYVSDPTTYTGTDASGCTGSHALSTSDHPTGTWRVELWVNGQKLGEAAFNIILEIRGPGYDGSFDPIPTDCSHIFGWAVDYSSSAHVAVDVAVDGFPIIRGVPANQDRIDLTGPKVNSAWNYYQLQQFQDGQSHQIHVYYSGTQIDLPGSPRQFPPSGAQGSCFSGGNTPTSGTQRWVLDGSKDARALGYYVEIDRTPLPDGYSQYAFLVVTNFDAGSQGLYRIGFTMTNPCGTTVDQSSLTFDVNSGNYDSILKHPQDGWSPPPASGFDLDVGEFSIFVFNLVPFKWQVSAAIGFLEYVAAMLNKNPIQGPTLTPSSDLRSKIQNQNLYTTRRILFDNGAKKTYTGARIQVRVKETGTNDWPDFFLLVDANNFNGLMSVQFDSTRRDSPIVKRLF